MKNKIGAVEFQPEVVIYDGEKKAVEQAIAIADEFGYGNLIAHLQSAWAVKLIKSGLSQDAAIDRVCGNTPYPLPKKI